MNNYTIDDFDESGNLVLGGSLIAILIYSSRYLLYGPLSLVASRSGKIGAAVELDVSFLTVDSPFEMLVSIPAIIVIYVALFRSVNSGRLHRWIWARGKPLLVLGAIGQLVLQIMPISSPSHVTNIVLAGITVNLYVLYHLLTANRVVDVFAMFPTIESNNASD